MKIAIIGAGLSGLTFYLFLAKLAVTEGHTIVIYEARDRNAAKGEEGEPYNASLIGASIGLSSIGLKVIERLDPALLEEVIQTGHGLREWKFSSSRGWALGSIPVAKSEKTVMIGREAFRKCLLKRVPSTVIQKKKLTAINWKESANRNEIAFDDGTTEAVDLIVGADGIWSKVRKAMFQNPEDGSYEYAPHYEGLVGVGGFVPSSKLVNVPDGEVDLVFGGNGFMGFSYTNSSASDVTKHGDMAVWWSTWSVKVCPEDWRQFDREEARRQLKTRHSQWRNEAVLSIISDVQVELLYPTFVTPLLPIWSKQSCTLIGDAAHALQPSSGAGASMAFEDAEALALLLQHHLSQDALSGHRKAIETYAKIRKPRVDRVHKKAQQLAGMKQDMNIIEEMMMYFFIWLANRFQFNKKYEQDMRDYEVPEAVKQAIDQGD